jgi:ApaG protein
MAMPAHEIDIQVDTLYLPEHSDEQNQQFVFGYRVTLTNTSENEYQLMRRFWQITDGNGEIEEVNGEGVVGQQPSLAPGGSFHYSSRAVLKTQVGVMQGNYTWQSMDGRTFVTTIPTFRLATPNSLH